MSHFPVFLSCYCFHNSCLDYYCSLSVGARVSRAYEVGMTTIYIVEYFIDELDMI